MTTRKAIVLSLVGLTTLCAAALHAADAAPGPEWHSSLEKAQAAAKDSGKFILAVFTGSDRGGIPAQMEAEILATPEFRKWAEKLVLLKIDFLATHTALTREQKIAMVETAQRYDVRGLPSIRFLDADGTLVGRHQYMRGGPAVWIPAAETALVPARFLGKPWLASSIAEGLKLAEDNARPLVLVLSTDAAGIAQFKDKLTGSKALAMRNVVLVHVDLTVAEQIDADFKALGVKPESSCIVIDPAEPKKPVAIVARDTAKPVPDALLEALPWIWDDFDAALAKAKALDLPMLVDFTGSDWCGWCMKLDKDVFETDVFKKWAKGKVVLLKLDSPRFLPQTAEVKARHQALALELGAATVQEVEGEQRLSMGYPTLLLVSPEGKTFARLHHLADGPEAWCGAADKALADAP
jgi:thioredoxin-related protein